MSYRTRLSPQAYIDGVLSGNRFALSRAITLIESQREADMQLAETVMAGILPHTGKAIRVGITGVPGVGKSTFIEAFGLHLLAQGEQIAVLAIDPSSPETGGSIMGDKTRMTRLANEPNAFIRPTPAGTSLGGVARKTRETMLLCEAAGYTFLLIETVGIGQSEVAVKQMTDFFLLLMLAGAGDELQGIKKGVMEMADLLAITKADGENLLPAKRARADYQAALHLYRERASQWRPQVVVCSAAEDTNLDTIASLIRQFADEMQARGWWHQNRTHQNTHWMHESIKDALLHAFYHAPDVQQQLPALTEAVAHARISPYQAARQLIAAFGKV